MHKIFTLVIYCAQLLKSLGTTALKKTILLLMKANCANKQVDQVDKNRNLLEKKIVEL